MNTLGNSRLNSEISIKIENSQTIINEEEKEIENYNNKIIEQHIETQTIRFQFIDYVNLIFCSLLNMLCCLYWGYLP